jgi:hypothetical protein
LFEKKNKTKTKTARTVRDMSQWQKGVFVVVCKQPLPLPPSTDTPSFFLPGRTTGASKQEMPLLLRCWIEGLCAGVVGQYIETDVHMQGSLVTVWKTVRTTEGEVAFCTRQSIDTLDRALSSRVKSVDFVWRTHGRHEYVWTDSLPSSAEARFINNKLPDMHFKVASYDVVAAGDRLSCRTSDRKHGSRAGLVESAYGLL